MQVKYPKDGSKKMSNTISLNQNDKSIQLNDNNASTLIPVLTGLIMINKIKENDSIDLPPPIANLLKVRTSTLFSACSYSDYHYNKHNILN